MEERERKREREKDGKKEADETNEKLLLNILHRTQLKTERKYFYFFMFLIFLKEKKE